MAGDAFKDGQMKTAREVRRLEKILIVSGEAIRQRRKELLLSQEELAERANLHRTYISDLEYGKRNMTIFILFRVAKALKLKPSTLLKRAGIS